MPITTHTNNPSIDKDACDSALAAIDASKLAADSNSSASATARALSYAVQRHRALVTGVIRFTEQQVHQPCATPAVLDTPQAAYSHLCVKPSASARLERCRGLQLRLEGDVLQTAALHQPFHLECCESVAQDMGLKRAMAKDRLRLNEELLGGLQHVTDLIFRSLALDPNSTELQVSVSDMVRQAFAAAGIDIPALAMPLEIYASVAARWVAIEREITELHLQVLQLELGQRRLSLYHSIAQYLASEARALIETQLDHDDALLPGEVHLAESQLMDCIDDPFLGRWPHPLGLRFAVI
jgi:hypothetical protein